MKAKAPWLAFGGLALAGMLVSALLVGAANSATPTGAPVIKRISASFIYVNNNKPDNCGWTIGVVFPSTAGAISYTVQYWDGYWKKVITAKVTEAQIAQGDAELRRLKLVPAGSHFLGVTGGYYSPPCTKDGGDATQNGRFSKGAKAWATFPANYKPAQPDGADWTMPRRLTGPPNGPQGLPTSKEIHPRSWKARVFLTSKGQPARCPSDLRFRWVVKPPAGAKLISGQPKPGCSFALEGSKLGSYTATATPEKLQKGKWVTAGSVIRKSIALQDFVIVGLGDSNGSGEGNPPFHYPTCNRSIASYQYQAALYVETQDPRSSVTFLHASCSGARIDHLVTTNYEGINPGGDRQLPQIRRIATDLSFQGTPRKVDAVVVSAGVNDLTFGPLIAFCVDAVAKAPNTPCEELPVVEKIDNGNRVSGFKAAQAASTPTLRVRLAGLLKELPSRYVPLAPALNRPLEAGGLGVASKNVLITQYPDFTNGDDGKPCGPGSGVARFGTSTWTWLGLNAKLLNRTISSAAARYGWTLVPTNIGAFATSGYCSTHSLIVGIIGAISAGDSAGPFHPNRAAHLNQAEQVEPRLCRALGLGTRCLGR